MCCFINEASTGPTRPEIGKDAPALLLTTSGTTGAPKFVTHTPATLLASMKAFACAHLDDTQIVLNVLPLVHVTGLFCLLASVNVGAAMILVERFDPDALLDQVESHRCRRLCPIQLQIEFEVIFGAPLRNI